MKKIKNIVRNVNKGGQLITERCININNICYISNLANNPMEPNNRQYNITMINGDILSCSKEEYDNLKSLLKRKK